MSKGKLGNKAVCKTSYKYLLTCLLRLVPIPISMMAGFDDMDDGDAIPAAPEDLMQMNEAQASGGR